MNFHQRLAGGRSFQTRQRLQIQASLHHPTSRIQNVRSAEPQFAIPQRSFAGRGNRGSRRKRPIQNGTRRHRHLMPPTLTQERHDLPNLDDLLGRRTNEARQAFPRFLTQQPKPTTPGHGRTQRGVVREGSQDRFQHFAGRQMMPQPESLRRPFHPRHRQTARCSLHPSPSVSDHRLPPCPRTNPAERLTAFQGRLQIIVGHGPELNHETGWIRRWVHR